MIAEKLKEARLLLRKSQVDAATESGLSQRDISQLENGKKEFIPTEYIQYLNKLGVDINSLFEESENVHLNVHPNVHLIQEKPFKPIEKIDIRGGRRKPNVILVPVKARAGYMAGYGDQEYIEHLEVYSVPGCTNGNYRMFEIDGDSMYPTFSPGDFAVGRAETDTASLKQGAIYIIVSHTEGIIIKRLLNGQKTPSKMVFGSDNQAFRPTELESSAIAEMWEFYMLLTTAPGQPDPAAARLRNLEHEVEDIKRLLQNK